MKQYVTFLRGINVGGKNIIKMTDLVSCFESIGFVDILTYIQSGNIIFRTHETNKTSLTNQIEKALTTQFNFDSKIVLLSQTQFETVIRDAPPDFGTFPDKFKYDVIFLRDGFTPNEMINRIKTKEGVDTAFAGSLTLYFSRLISKVKQSRLKNIMTLPEYQNMTIRNWNTTKKIFYLMDNNKITNA
jgi:uncharacterized protein (DUF1697 family)